MPLSESPYSRAFTRIAKLRQAQPELKAILDYYEALLKAQEEMKGAFHPDLAGLDIERCQKRNSEGLPFLQPEDIKIDWGLFDSLFGRIGQISRQHAERPDSIGSWPSISGNSGEWHDTLLKGLLEDGAMLGRVAERTGISLDVFTFLACQTAAPFLEAYAERLRESVDDSAWLKGNCPICGGEPLMGKLEQEVGKRILQCHLCRTEWESRRLECPFCGNNDQETLRYFYDEQEPDYRVEVCDLCKAYLKTVDTRKREGEPALLAENVATIHLDLVAEQEGYRRETSRLFGPR